jgi:hypothetical protein
MMSLWQNLTIIKQYLTIIKESAESASSEKWLQNMVNFAKSGAARASTPNHHPQALRGQYTPAPQRGDMGGRQNARYFRSPGHSIYTGVLLKKTVLGILKSSQSKPLIFQICWAFHSVGIDPNLFQKAKDL